MLLLTVVVVRPTALGSEAAIVAVLARLAAKAAASPEPTASGAAFAVVRARRLWPGGLTPVP
jgi:hypothetical protein